MSSQSSSSSTSTYDALNQARIEQYTQSIIISSPVSLSKTSAKKLPSEFDLFDRQQSFNQHLTIQSNILMRTPDRPHAKQKRIVDLTKTMTIKGKKGKLYDQVCPVCLSNYSMPLGVLSCRHKFCFQCIQIWSKTSTVCPCCRKKFTQIIKKHENKGLIEIIKVAQKQMQFREEDYFICYVCGRGDNQNVLLICDMCDFNCCHIFCDPELNNTIPQGDWFCRNCRPEMQQTQINQTQLNSQAQQNKPVATRTRSRAIRDVQSQAELFRRLRRRR